MWDVYRELGFDTDGDERFYGSDDALAELLVDAAKTERADYDEAINDLPNAVDVCKAAGWRVVKTRRQQTGFNFDGEKIVEEL